MVSRTEMIAIDVEMDYEDLRGHQSRTVLQDSSL